MSAAIPTVAPERRGPERVRLPWGAFAGLWTVTMLGLLAIGMTLPVLPQYVTGPLGSGNLAVGIVIGSFSVTAVFGRPWAGRLADERGRRAAMVLGAALSAAGGALYFAGSLGIGALIFARLVIGVGEGMTFTAGAAWAVDLAPESRRGRVIGLYGLSVWTGLALGPPIGQAILDVAGFDLVWAAAALAPLIGAVIAFRIRQSGEVASPVRRQSFLVREALMPGVALSLGTIGFAAISSFIVLHLQAEGIGHGATVFAAFAASVVIVRLVGGDLPDRLGAAPAALGAAVIEAVGLIAVGLAESLGVAIVGAAVMGAAFSTLYPALSLLVVESAPEGRRAAALGTFTAFFDIGVGVGAVLAGALASAAGYPAAFVAAGAFALLTAILVGARLMPGRHRPASAEAVG